MPDLFFLLSSRGLYMSLFFFFPPRVFISTVPDLTFSPSTAGPIDQFRAQVMSLGLPGLADLGRFKNLSSPFCARSPPSISEQPCALFPAAFSFPTHPPNPPLPRRALLIVAVRARSQFHF